MVSQDLGFHLSWSHLVNDSLHEIIDNQRYLIENMFNCVVSNVLVLAYGSGHEGGPVLFPGFAIKWFFQLHIQALP